MANTWLHILNPMEPFTMANNIPNVSMDHLTSASQVVYLSEWQAYEKKKLRVCEGKVSSQLVSGVRCLFATFFVFYIYKRLKETQKRREVPKGHSILEEFV